MSLKIFNSKNIDIENIFQHPNILKKISLEKKTISLLKNKKPYISIISSKRLSELLKIEKQYFKLLQSKISTKKNLYKESYNIFYRNKFQMYSEWKPDKNFIQLSSIWGIYLNSSVTASELAYFIDYWKAEGKMFHHVQWQQKLARSLQFNRKINKEKRDVFHLPEPDISIPEGFIG